MYVAPTRPRLAVARALRSVAGARTPGGAAFDPDLLDRRDPRLIAALLPAIERVNRLYLRLRVDGLEHLGREPALYVSNHNGGIMGPDLACTLGTLWEFVGPDFPLYALAHDFAMRQLRPLGRVLQRFGAMRAHPDNASRAIRAGGQVLAYPGGDLDAYRHFRRRDEIVFGPRAGFVRVAQGEGVPIVPIVAHGAHRSALIFSEGELLARALRLSRWGRLERFPLALSLPWGLAVGPWTPYLPLPFPIRLRVLRPIHVAKSEAPDRARDRIRAEMQRALSAMSCDARARRP